MIGVGNSLLRGTETPICLLDTLSREVYCLLGACVRDATKRLPSLVPSINYCLLLLFHMGTGDRDGSGLRSIKKDYRALEVVVRDSSTSSILPVKGKGFERAS